MNYTVGDVVALSTHPYFQTADSDSILIGGNINSLSPIMVIVETLKETSPSNEKSSGMEVVEKDTFQCKCLRYSHKSGTFEDSWISSRLLKIIKRDSNKVSLPYGTTVVFKTLSIESQKKQNKFKGSNDSFPENNKYCIFRFSSPVMQVIGTAKNDSKDPFLDRKTGKIKREVTSGLIKCRYYNSVSDKFSEALIPVEALEKLYKVSSDFLSEIREDIDHKYLYKSDADSQLLIQTILKPLRIIYNSGSYFLEAKDYLQNNVVEILITGDKAQFEAIKEKLAQLPNFEIVKKKLITKWLDKLSLLKLPKSKYWRIKYTDYNGVFSIRTIYDVYFHSEKLSDDKTNEYILGKCLSSNSEERIFKIERIQRVQVLDIDWNKNGKKAPSKGAEKSVAISEN